MLLLFQVLRGLCYKSVERSALLMKSTIFDSCPGPSVSLSEVVLIFDSVRACWKVGHSKNICFTETTQ